MRRKDKLLPSRPIRLTSSTLKSTTPVSKPPPLRKLLMLMPPGKLDMVPKRDSHLTPPERPGPPTCQTMLSRTQISTSKPQLQLRRLWPMPLKLMPTQRRPKPPQLKLPQLSSNSTRAEDHSLNKETNLNLNQNPHQDPQPQAHPQDHQAENLHQTEINKCKFA